MHLFLPFSHAVGAASHAAAAPPCLARVKALRHSLLAYQLLPCVL